MSVADKIRVAVLYGGRSAEHEVSLQSAANVIQFLDKKRFDVIPIAIDKQGNWFIGKEIFNESLAHKQVPALRHSSPTWFTPEWVTKNEQSQLVPTISSSSSYFDVIFPVVHGSYCEDGTLQGLLELAGVPYVGCGVLASAVGMDKDIAKRLANDAGVKVAPYQVLKIAQWIRNREHALAAINQELDYPLFIKPANTGSSIGISKVKSSTELAAAIDEAFKFDNKILIEKGLRVLELEVAVLEAMDGCEPIASVVGEVKPSHEFYSYDAKYLDDHGAELCIPATVNETIRQEAQMAAKQLFQALECEGMARVDLFYDLDSNAIYFNEINTIPGFTKISMYPKLMAASGMEYTELLTHLVELALKRRNVRSKLITSYTE